MQSIVFRVIPYTIDLQFDICSDVQCFVEYWENQRFQFIAEEVVCGAGKFSRFGKE
jgi:hypothetical protein